MNNFRLVSRIHIPRQQRLLHTSRPVALTPSTRSQSGRDPSISQGHATSSSQSHPHDPQSQSASKGLNAEAGESAPHDAASASRGQKAPNEGRGNPESVGFAEQVGSASASAGASDKRDASKGGQEEPAPPGLFSTIKKAVGLGTTTNDVKQNKGVGEGITGTGTNPTRARHYHSSAVLRAAETKGQAPDAARQPKEKTFGEQNEHLVHKRSTEDADRGRGNAGSDPVLPSHQQEGPMSQKEGGTGSDLKNPVRLEGSSKA